MSVIFTLNGNTSITGWEDNGKDHDVDGNYGWEDNGKDHDVDGNYSSHEDGKHSE